MEENIEVDPELRSRMQALMQHYLSTDDIDENTTTLTNNIVQQPEVEGGGDGGGCSDDDGTQKNILPLPSSLPPTLPIPSLDVESVKIEPTVKKIIRKQEPPSVAVKKIVDLFGGHSLVNKKDLEQIGIHQTEICARMSHLSRQLKNQNELSQNLFVEASEDLNEYISLLDNMKTMMHDINSKLNDVKKNMVDTE
jgi:hypothetical protein